MRKATVLGVLALAGTLASPAFADDYTGFRLQLTMGEDHLEGNFAYNPVGVESLNTGRFAYGFGAGWALNKWLAVEANVRSGGEFNQNAFPDFVESINAVPLPPDVDSGGPFFKVRNDLGGVDASVVGSFWIGNKFSVFGRAGFFAWRSETSYKFGDPDSAIVNDAADDSGFAPLFGVGLQTVLDGALVRVEYQRSDVGDLTNGSNFGQFDNIVSSFNFSIVWTL
jgi:hypothetical protein